MSGVLLPVLIASLLGSLHCAGMCGPFLSVATRKGGPSGSRLGTPLAYHLGRLTTYAILGAIAGGLGQLLDLAGALAGLARASALVAGVMMVTWGVRGLVPRPALLSIGTAPKSSGGWLSKVLLLLQGQRPLRRGFVLGLATTLIPCGWLHAFVVTAAATGGVVSGLLVMGAFWLGTVPMLCGVSWGLERLSARLGSRVRALSACLVACAGVALIVLRLGAPDLVTPDGNAGPGQASAADCPLHRK